MASCGWLWVSPQKTTGYAKLFKSGPFALETYCWSMATIIEQSVNNIWLSEKQAHYLPCLYIPCEYWTIL